MGTREDRVRGALLGTFVGDALGRRWEGRRGTPGRTGEVRLARSESARTLRYTDDTQLALALAEHLVDHPDVEPAALVRTFLGHYEGTRGYGGGFRRLVGRWREGVPWEDAATIVFPDGSFGNGAAMRVAPVGALHAGDPARITAVARRQAEVSHAHPLGWQGAVAVALGVGHAVVAGDFTAADLHRLATQGHAEGLSAGLAAAADLAERWPNDPSLALRDVGGTLGTNVTAQGSVPAALWVAAVATEVREAVALALGLGGDADTIAAMATAVVAAARGATNIPDEWLARCEDGARGITYARALADRLAAAV